MPIANKPRIFRPILFLLLASFALGCAAPNLPEQGIISETPLDQEGIVFGTLSSDSEAQTGLATRYFIFFGPKPDASNPQLRSWTLQADTLSSVFFAIRLPAGDYYVSGLRSGRSVSYVRARFSVASNRATYIGALQVSFFEGQGMFGQTTANVTVNVTNDLDDALQQYKQRNPRLPYEITTSLMAIEE